MRKLHLLLLIVSIILILYEILLMIIYKDIAQAKLVCFLAIILCIYSYLFLIHKMPKVISIILLLIFISFIFVEGNILYYSIDRTQNKQYDTIIVLGAQVRGDRPSSAFKYRIQRARKYLDQYPDTLVIASGGQGDNEDITEARCIQENIGECNIILEEDSTSTVENLKYSSQYIEGSCAVVSNSFHLYRVKLIAERLHMNIDLIPAQNHLLTYPHFLIREYFGILKEYIKTYL